MRQPIAGKPRSYRNSQSSSVGARLARDQGQQDCNSWHKSGYVIDTGNQRRLPHLRQRRRTPFSPQAKRVAAFFRSGPTARGRWSGRNGAPRKSS
ncbi:hypothetical protein C4K22_1966 [Pseudomonas chlororaphis subsp. aurantiaca]|nr:hypothetical protein C4K22_1966 [Pseudomonas chlororaphis subsp. aurantiaca]AZD41053.1 hypothetical protein C4K21_1969 [Pseudomonas chlororaphis subsp. aurantiaca]